MEQQRMIDEAATAVAEDNVELAQCFVIKQAVERAVPEMERRLAGEFENRRRMKLDSVILIDQSVLSYQAEKMPEKIRINVGQIGSQQQQVYEEFAKQIPGKMFNTLDHSA